MQNYNNPSDTKKYKNLPSEEKLEFDKATEKRNEAYYSFCDKTITLSTGFLALTITFKNSFVTTDVSCPSLLYLSWACFTVAILSATYIHWGQAFIYNRRANEILNSKPGSGKLPIRFYVCRYIMFLSFPAAVLCFSIFAIINNI